jgi:hypothetical protein
LFKPISIELSYIQKWDLIEGDMTWTEIHHIDDGIKQNMGEPPKRRKIYNGTKDWRLIRNEPTKFDIICQP